LVPLLESGNQFFGKTLGKHDSEPSTTESEQSKDTVLVALPVNAACSKLRFSKSVSGAVRRFYLVA